VLTRHVETSRRRSRSILRASSAQSRSQRSNAEDQQQPIRRAAGRVIEMALAAAR
jgi:hypothetical protein